MNALLYIAKSGIQWRMLPKEFAPWESVYYYFRKWKRDGLIEETHDSLVVRIRKRRKRHIVVDTLGLVMIIVIHTANINYSIGAKEVMRSLKDKYLCGIVKIFADGGYMGELIECVRMQFHWTLEIVKRTEEHTFKVLPKRWIVERTFARISFHRRLSKDYERLPESGTAFIHLSMIRLIVNRISK